MDEINNEYINTDSNLSISPLLSKSSEGFHQQITKILDNTQNIYKHFEEIFKLINTIITPELQNTLKEVGNSLKQSEEYLQRKDIAVPFIESGLWLTPSMTPSLVMQVNERYEQGKKRVISALIDGFYRRNNWEILRYAVARWESYDFFKQRMDIFFDALEAHMQQKWTLSIPTLIPHIEGIAGEILLANNFTLPKNVPKPSSLYSKFPKDKVTPTMDVVISSLLHYLEGTLYVYKDFSKYPKIRRLKNLNRNAIMHGYQLNYATRLNSLKCFLALDSLSMLKGNIPKHV